MTTQEVEQSIKGGFDETNPKGGHLSGLLGKKHLK